MPSDLVYGVLGMPAYDFSGPASRYNLGQHDGTLGDFAVTGSFTDA